DQRMQDSLERSEPLAHLGIAALRPLEADMRVLHCPVADRVPSLDGKLSPSGSDARFLFEGAKHRSRSLLAPCFPFGMLPQQGCDLPRQLRWDLDLILSRHLGVVEQDRNWPITDRQARLLPQRG